MAASLVLVDMIHMQRQLTRARLLLIALVVAVLCMIVITTSLHAQAFLFTSIVAVDAENSHGYAPDFVPTVALPKDRNDVDPDADCPFRQSPLYRSVFVYPSPSDSLFESMKSERAIVVNGTVPTWPWLEMNEKFRKEKFLVYNVHHNEMNHFSLEMYVHDIFTHPKSCLQTNDPEAAKLFYVPHLETIHWRGLESLRKLPKEWVKKRMTPYGEALLAAIDGNYDLWEERYGLSSQYWKRKQGADHFFVMAEPCNGLQHIPGARANTNFVRTQRQNRPPIVISQELSATYVRMYPKCAAKNIVMPYANINGKWFRGDFEQEAKAIRLTLFSNETSSRSEVKDHRPLLVHYRGGAHGQCKWLRQGLARNHRCGKSFGMAEKKRIPRPLLMHLSTFCPCPAGDSPSARRMNDAVVAGCIPVVLSTDYVWPLSKDFDPTSGIDPATFSIRLNFSEFGRFLYEDQCRRIDDGNLTLEEYLETVPDVEIRRLREGVKMVAPMFEYYQRRNMSDTPLSDRILPDGGAAQTLILALSRRATENRWEQCQEELKLPHPPDPTTNPC